MAPSKESIMVKQLVEEIAGRFEMTKEFIALKLREQDSKVGEQTAAIKAEIIHLSRDMEEIAGLIRGKGDSPGIRQDMAMIKLAVAQFDHRLTKVEGQRGCYYAATVRGKYLVIGSVVSAIGLAAAAFVTALAKGGP